CFFFQAEDGIRDATVTGVKTCALPISRRTVEVADRITHQTEARACSADAVTQQRGARVQCTATAAHGARSRGKIDPVKDVKHVGLQPDFNPLANGDAFENREIPVSKAWGAKPITGEVANSAGRRRGERGRVQPLRPSA